jgi:hypothetical protein
MRRRSVVLAVPVVLGMAGCGGGAASSSTTNAGAIHVTANHRVCEDLGQYQDELTGTITILSVNAPHPDQLRLVNQLQINAAKATSRTLQTDVQVLQPLLVGPTPNPTSYSAAMETILATCSKLGYPIKPFRATAKPIS